MGEQELTEIKNLNDDDLLTVYHKISDHIHYLEGSIIDTTAEVVESEETSDEQQS